MFRKFIETNYAAKLLVQLNIIILLSLELRSMKDTKNKK